LFGKEAGFSRDFPAKAEAKSEKRAQAR